MTADVHSLEYTKIPKVLLMITEDVSGLHIPLKLNRPSHFRLWYSECQHARMQGVCAHTLWAMPHILLGTNGMHLMRHGVVPNLCKKQEVSVHMSTILGRFLVTQRCASSRKNWECNWSHHTSLDLIQM